MSEATHARFTFAAGDYAAGELEVARVSGSEWVSKPSSFDVDVIARAGERAPVTHLLGTRGRLAFPEPGCRQIAGVVARIQAHGTVDDLPLYRLRLVPALWLLGQRKTSRIFQHLAVPDIVRAVLSEHRVEHRWEIERAYPEREYCVQYRETDLHFVTRLLAEEGIFYLVADPPADSADAPETIVFADSPSAHRPIPGDPRLPVRTTGALRSGEHVASFALEEQVRSAATLHRGYDFKRPMLDLRGAARASRRAADAAELEVYDHDGDPEEGRIDGAGARSALEQLRARAATARGESNCQRLAPGASFELFDHGRDDLDRRYTVVRLDHEARQIAGQRLHGGGDETYTNHFRCVPERVAYRPKRPRRALQQVMETATVVGPPGEEIHVDELGRIKVQFHWDREGKHDEHSSCWLRSMQPWAGSAWGSQFIPRIGMEVVVSFVGGDIDRPMVVGSVYNALNPTPYPLPAHKTQSGIKTRTSPGGGGSNELRFEDAAGKEQVYLHAQKDLDELVENNHTRTVKGDEAIAIGRTSKVDVGGDQEVSVQGNEVVTIHKNLVMHVVGRQIIHVDGQGASGGGDTGAAPPGPAEAAKAGDGGAGPAGAVEAVAETEALGERVAAAKLLFLREQVPDECHGRARALVSVVEAAAEQVGEVQQDAMGLGAGPGEMERGVAVMARAREVREVVGRTITDALQPAPVGMHRLQVAVVERLQGLWRRVDGVERGLAGGAGRASPAASGSGRGGGGADVVDWDNRGLEGDSTLAIANGKGIVDAKDGLVLKGDGGYISIVGGVLRLSAPNIVLVGDTIGIVGDTTDVSGSTIRILGGQTFIAGRPIKLN